MPSLQITEISGDWEIRITIGNQLTPQAGGETSRWGRWTPRSSERRDASKWAVRASLEEPSIEIQSNISHR